MAVVKHNGRVTENMEKEAKEAEATEYVRTLTDAELVGLALDLQRRAAALAQSGYPLPMQQLENHHLIGLLEHLVGREDALRVKEWHMTFVDRYFDQIEAEQRMRMLSALDGVVPS